MDRVWSHKQTEAGSVAGEGLKRTWHEEFAVVASYPIQAKNRSRDHRDAASLSPVLLILDLSALCFQSHNLSSKTLEAKCRRQTSLVRDAESVRLGLPPSCSLFISLFHRSVVLSSNILGRELRRHTLHQLRDSKWPNLFHLLD